MEDKFGSESHHSIFKRLYLTGLELVLPPNSFLMAASASLRSVFPSFELRQTSTSIGHENLELMDNSSLEICRDGPVSAGSFAATSILTAISTFNTIIDETSKKFHFKENDDLQSATLKYFSISSQLPTSDYFKRIWKLGDEPKQVRSAPFQTDEMLRKLLVARGSSSTLISSYMGSRYSDTGFIVQQNLIEPLSMFEVNLLDAIRQNNALVLLPPRYLPFALCLSLANIFVRTTFEELALIVFSSSADSETFQKYAEVRTN